MCHYSRVEEIEVVFSVVVASKMVAGGGVGRAGLLLPRKLLCVVIGAGEEG